MAPRSDCFERHGNVTRCCNKRLSWGPHWPCNLFAWLLILGISIVFMVICGIRLHWGVVVLDSLTCLACAVAFAVTTCKDPGYLERSTPEELELRKLELERRTEVESGFSGQPADAMLNFTPCNKCFVMRERGTQHCYDCGLCVVDLDHHCPWSGKCIGKGNMKPFQFFLGTLCTHLVVTVIVRPLFPFLSFPFLKKKVKTPSSHLL